MEDVLCYSIDSESETGEPIAKKFGVQGLPALLFLDPDGSVRDKITGYLPPEPFIAEVQRIQRNEGTLPDLRKQVAANGKDVDLRWELAQKLQEVGDTEGYEEQMAAIHELDPEGKSLPMRRLAFENTWAECKDSLEVAPLVAFLQEEQHAEILFDGWGLLSRISDYKRRNALNEGDTEAAGQHLSDYVTYTQKQWQYVPDDKDTVAGLGNQIGWTMYELHADLSADQLAWAVEVARKAVDASEKKDPNVLDTLGCLLFASGDKAGAIELLELCIRLDPENSAWTDRIEEFNTEA